MALEALKVFRELADEGKAVVLITHDIDLAFHIADRIAVFYAGTTVEMVWVEEIFWRCGKLRHPYSKALWRALSQNGFRPIPGFQPRAGICQRDVSFLQDVPIRQKSVKMIFP